MKQRLFTHCLNRALFKFFLIISLVTSLSCEIITAQSVYDVLRRPGGNTPGPVWLHFSDAPNSLYHHLSKQAYELLENRSNMIVGFNSLAEWQKRQKYIRETMMSIVGPFPEKTPLNPNILKTVVKDGYRVEHVVFESQPGFYVTSSLFIPNGMKRGSRLPAVLYCSGHTDIAYRSTAGTYQQLILNLVKKGFIVFAIDPVGQGERLQYYNPMTGKSDIGSSTAEHSYCGIQAFIAGSSLARHMIFDGIRAVDYLLTRREVDPDRLAITGCSGGGTQSAYIAAMDERIKVAAPQCYITTFTRLLQTLGPQDAEQNLFHGIFRQIDHADFLLVRAPKPAMILATTEDFFNIHGSREAAREVARIYKAYGMENNFGMAEDAGLHGTTRKNREAMYAFFQKHLNHPGDPAEIDVEFLTMEEMQITPKGQVFTSFGGETVFSLNQKDAEKLMTNLQASRQNPDKHLPEAVKAAEELSGYRKPAGVDEPVLNSRIYRENYVVEKYFVQGEGDYVIPFLLMKPVKPNNKALLYLHPAGKATEAAEGGEIEWFVKNGYTVLAPDLLGIGEMGSGSSISNSVYFASILIGRSIAGIQAGDINRLAMLLKKYEGITEVYALARKEMAPALLHAAAFSREISRVALIESYSSYRSIVMNRFYNSRFVPGTVAGSLNKYDLPDLAANLAPRKLMMINVTDGNGESIDNATISSDFTIVRTSYQQKNAAGQFNIVSDDVSSGKLFNILLPWLQ